MVSEKSDTEIIREVLEEDVDSFEVLVMRYKADVFRQVSRHVPFDLVEEIAQDVFVRAFQSLRSYRGESGFRTWLNTISVRTCYDYWRKHYRSREVALRPVTQNSVDPMDHAIAEQSFQVSKKKSTEEETRETLQWALDQLSPEDRMVLELVHLEEKSVKEAARLLGWSISNVKIRAFRSRRKLKKILLGSYQ